jgi:hypothetical protein
MKIKYKTRWEEISKVEIDRETEISVWLKGKNNSVRKMTSWECYFDTFSEAKEHLRQVELKEIKSYEKSIEYHREKLKKIESIQEF